MYDLPHYKEPDQQVLLAFMQAHPFVILTGVDAHQQPVVTHVPVLIDERDGYLFLRGHIMKQTDHYKAFAGNPAVVAVFTGPHTYVSASWYTNPRQGSTWNYMTVHAHGKLSFLGEEALWQVLKETTSRFENNPQSPASYEHLPADYLERMGKAIVAFEIQVTALRHVFKLSQNRDADSYRSIITKLEAGSAPAQSIAQEMKQRLSSMEQKDSDNHSGTNQ